MAFLSGWTFLAYRETGSAEYVAWSLVSAVSVIGLIAYGRFFLRKLRNVSFL